jgi:DNA-3-methyladenine glycosylase II
MPHMWCWLVTVILTRPLRRWPGSWRWTSTGAAGRRWATATGDRRCAGPAPGLRPCGFHSPYEAAAWSVLAQRLRSAQAARLRAELITHHGEDGAFPRPRILARAGLDLPGRKSEYLRAVAEAALDGLLDGAALRAVGPDQAIQRVQQVKGLGPFAAELVAVRGANAPDALPRHERRLDAEIAERYGLGRTLAYVSQAWRPYRTWAAVHLRALREQRTSEIAGR